MKNNKGSGADGGLTPADEEEKGRNQIKVVRVKRGSEMMSRGRGSSSGGKQAWRAAQVGKRVAKREQLGQVGILRVSEWITTNHKKHE